MMNHKWFTSGLLVLAMTVCSTVPLYGASTVRITPDYLRKIYSENLTLYEMTRSDSATIVFSRGTLERAGDLEKLHEANQDAFVALLRDHVTARVELVIKDLEASPLSAEERIGEELPGIYADLYARLVKLRNRESTDRERWTETIEATRVLVNLIDKQLKGPGTVISNPDE